MVAIRAQLIPLDGSPAIDLVKDLTLIGRKEGCDVCLRHKSISKLHCVLVKADGLLLLRDLGSTNGTRVNGQRVRRAHLLPNDELAIANHKFRVHFGPADRPEPAPDYTQKLDAKELAGLAAKREAPAPAVEPDHPPASAAHVNPLPDVYPEDARP